jgi:hypothetical protein
VGVESFRREGGGLIVERSGFELFAAFPLSTGVVAIAIVMRVLRRFVTDGAQ